MNSPLQQKSCIIPCSCYTAHSNGSPKNLFYFDTTTNYLTNHSNAYILEKISITNDLSPRWMTIFTLEHDESKNWTPLRITIHDGIAENALHRSTENIPRNGSQPTTVLPMSSRSGREGTKMGEVDVEVGGVLKMDGQETKIALNEGGRLVFWNGFLRLVTDCHVAHDPLLTNMRLLFLPVYSFT